uniref:SDR family oxidoreductase n=1 Tax=Streptomyces sp. NBC_00003 TaxID=2903608 RepID=A0AAU2UYQ5_9ACTN
MNSPIAVIGGTGRVGRLVTQRLLDRGEAVRVVGRSTERGRELPERAQFFLGDVREPETLRIPLRGCSGIVYTVEPGTDPAGPDSPESTLHTGVRNALAAARGGAVLPQFVLVSQRYVTRRDHPMNAYGRMLDWRLAGEDAVRVSGLPYTVVRPSWLTDLDGDSRITLEQGDRRDGYVSRRDVAEACVQALYCPSARGVTFEMRSEPGSGPTAWEPLFARLRSDEPAYEAGVHRLSDPVADRAIA